MTIPTLMSKYQKHTYVVGLKKAYAQLQNAFKMMPLTEGCPAGDYECAGWTTTNGATSLDIDGKHFNNFLEKQNYLLSKQFKVAKSDFDYYNDKNCIFSSTASGGTPCFYTADGMIFASSGGYILVDVNGAKGPNKMGRDRFGFGTTLNYYEPMILPCGSKNPEGKYYNCALSDSEYSSRDSSKCTTQNVDKKFFEEATSCTARVLEEDAMNY